MLRCQIRRYGYLCVKVDTCLVFDMTFLNWFLVLLLPLRSHRLELVIESWHDGLAESRKTFAGLNEWIALYL